MAGMWELPECTPGANMFAVPFSAASEALLTLRHSITVTNYTVRIYHCDESGAAALAADPASRWVPLDQLPGTALTGLARKVLTRLALWPSTRAQLAAR